MTARLGRQDKASCLAAGTSFLSFCLHIVFVRSPIEPVEVRRAALFRFFLLCFQCSERRRPRHAAESETAALRWRKYFYAVSRVTAFLALAGYLSTSNRRLMARNEDDFRIRPGKVRDRGCRTSARRIGGMRRRPTSFLGEVHQAIRRAGGNPDRLGQHRKGRRPVQCAGPGRCNGADASRIGTRGAGTGAACARGRGGWR